MDDKIVDSHCFDCEMWRPGCKCEHSSPTSNADHPGYQYPSPPLAHAALPSEVHPTNREADPDKTFGAGDDNTSSIIPDSSMVPPTLPSDTRFFQVPQFLRIPQFAQPVPASLNLEEPLISTSRKIRCLLCTSYAQTGKAARSCDWEINSSPQGCTRCRIYGLICVVDGIALPPRPSISTQRPAVFLICQPCRKNNTRCDRAIPCEACISRGDPDACTRGKTHGTFPRELGVGTELYPYLSSMRGGPTGVNDSNNYPHPYEQPPDFHLQFFQWLNGGDLPLPPGYPQPSGFRPARPQIQIRVLPFSMPSETSIVGKAPTAPPQLSAPTMLSSGPQPEIKASTTQQAPEPRPIKIPPGDEFRLQGLAGTWLWNVSEELQAPPSPGPVVTLYNIDGMMIDLLDHVLLPETNPERANPVFLTALLPPHPNPMGTSALATVPASSSSNLLPDHSGLPCMEHVGEGSQYCGRATRATCVDLSHNRPVPVCSEHDLISRASLRQALAQMVLSLRAYACATCTSEAVHNPARFRNMRANVWGLPPDVFDQPSVAASHNISKSPGPPLPLTGCHCATKLLGRTLCAPHRLENFLRVRARAQEFKTFVQQTYLRTVCPFCLDRVGADSYNFLDYQGIPLRHLVYTCLACLGIVMLDPATHAAIATTATIPL